MSVNDLVLETPGVRSPTAKGRDYCLLLLGKTGHGKSATGNSIIGYREFQSSGRTQSVTQTAGMGCGNIEGDKIKVVDTPGLLDTCKDQETSAEAVMNAFAMGISLCPDGFHALVLVFKFGTRMTEEEVKAVNQLKEMLGENVIREYTVLVVTRGNDFDADEEGMTFKEWCRKEKGYMKDLLVECKYRCILFENKTKDKKALSDQRKALLECIDGLQSEGKRFSNGLFQQAKLTWNNLNKERKYCKVVNEVKAVLGDIAKELLKARESKSKMDDSFFEGLRGRLHELNHVAKDLDKPYDGLIFGQIEQMHERICRVQTQDDAGKREGEMLEFTKLIESMQGQHQKQMEIIQMKFMQQQKEMGDMMRIMMEKMSQQSAMSCNIL